VVVYLDLACPHCAAAWGNIRALPLRLCPRHFPVASRHPRAPALHHAAEAAGAQFPAAFHEMWDSILDDRGHQDDPHLWQRAAALGLDLERFERDRRSDGVAARVQRDFTGGIRAGIGSTPAAFANGRLLSGDLVAALADLAAVTVPY
jgi:protein-disulfide isomerase